MSDPGPHGSLVCINRDNFVLVFFIVYIYIASVSCRLPYCHIINRGRHPDDYYVLHERS